MSLFIRQKEYKNPHYDLIAASPLKSVDECVQLLIDSHGVKEVLKCFTTKDFRQDRRLSDLINDRVKANIAKRETLLRRSVLMSQSILMALVHQRTLSEVKNIGRLDGLNPVEIDILLCAYAHFVINKRVFCFENIVCRAKRTDEEVRLAITKLKAAELLEEADPIEVNRRTGKLAKTTKNRKYLKLSRSGHKALEDYWKLYLDKYNRLIEDFWQLILEELPDKNSTFESK